MAVTVTAAVQEQTACLTWTAERSTPEQAAERAMPGQTAECATPGQQDGLHFSYKSEVVAGGLSVVLLQPGQVEVWLPHASCRASSGQAAPKVRITCCR
mmetsp:Transcript_14530/g.42464  ORF Transcript_14530/g.42464 Transcript_14530/m.42464 type:complete len:99 (+) Transcript_14530:932-1228(+)